MADKGPHDTSAGAAHGPVKGADDLPQAVRVRRKRIRLSVVWLIPALAAAVAVGIAVQRILAEGPTITIDFTAAPGIEAGKAVLKYKEVTIGHVTSVDLVERDSRVRVTARITRSAGHLMMDKTQFWVVSPHIGLNGISGLGTLLSGNYIGVGPAAPGHPAWRHFQGLDEPPPITDETGRHFALSIADLGSLQAGSPIYYRSLQVGEVEKVTVAGLGKKFEVTAFIKAPYDQFVRTESRFWNASGLDVSFGENGIDVKTASLQALLGGGLCFDTPEFALTTPVAPMGAAFEVSATREVAMKQPEKLSREYLLSFHEPVRGLSKGASVTLMGLAVGEVAEIGLHYNPQTLAVHPLVRITFFPGQTARLFPQEQQDPVRRHTEQKDQMVAILRRLVNERGMRARLRSASLLTGARYISFEFDPKAPRVKVDWDSNPLQLPVASGGEIEDLQTKLESILSKVDKMPLDEIGRRAAAALQTAEQALHRADTLIQHVDATALPKISTALDDLDRALGNANATLLGKDAPGQEALREALEEVANTARSLRALTDYLERHPEALIRGRVGDQK